MTQTSHKHTNSLAKESSPYLLQHAHNPVNWLPWGKEAREKAIKENKLMLVSVGYSSCHWCHVMEHESFEDESVAEIMNDNFVCIKVDREERPDVDQVYMEAVQAMRNQGGWPLNCFTTPEGKPVYGGTYFPKKNWVDILNQLAELWKRSPEEVQEYGDKLAHGMQIAGALPILEDQKSWNQESIKKALSNWQTRMDNQHGGPDKAPKFPLPANYSFLLQYGIFTGNSTVLKHVELTLDKMAQGGIYDQVGGGFTRYSTDKFWKVPHFEKMLYDNAQLLSLYNLAYKHFNKTDYLHVTEGIKTWLNREMRDKSGSFYSALDADSEGVEGLFYIFDEDELSEKGLAEAYAKFYYTDGKALWEGKLIPVRKGSFAELSGELNLSEKACIEEFNELNSNLLSLRSKRPRPLTDDKSICSWNAMLASALLENFESTSDQKSLESANKILHFIENELFNAETGILSHSWKEGKPSEIGFLEDYAFLIQGQIAVYRATQKDSVLRRAKELTDIAIDRFFSLEQGLFFFTAQDQSDLISRPVELSDNVIPSSNSIMAQNLLELSAYFSHTHYREISDRLLAAVENSMIEYPEGYGNWANLYLKKLMGSPELVVIGSEAHSFYSELRMKDLQMFTVAVSQKESDLPIFANRFVRDKTLVYICRNQSCLKPLETIESAKTEINRFTEKFESH